VGSGRHGRIGLSRRAVRLPARLRDHRPPSRGAAPSAGRRCRSRALLTMDPAPSRALPGVRAPVRVEDPADPRLDEFTRLRDVRLRTRREPAEGLFIAEGARTIRRAIGAGYALRSILLTE